MRVSLVTRLALTPYQPLALLYLKAALVAWAGVAEADVTIHEFGPKTTPEDMASAVLDAAPDVVGASCYVWNGVALLDALRLVKAQRPDVRVVIGGPEVGPVPEAVLSRHPAVDVVVVSEGERPMAALVSRWRTGASIDDVAGVWSRGPAGLRDHGAAPIIALDELPSPHGRGWVSEADRVVCIETQRGCVFRCSFCFYNKDLSIRNRRFDLDRVKAEIRYWLGRDIRRLYLMDPVFNLNLARAKEICRFVAEHNVRRIPLHTEIWAEFVDDELAALMKAAHFTYVEIGLQTIDTDTLDVVDRRFRKPEFIAGTAHLRRHGVPFVIHVITGLPGDTLEAYLASIEFAASLEPNEINTFELLVLPGTALWRQASELGIAYDPEAPYRVRATPQLPAEALAEARRVNLASYPLSASAALRLFRRETGMPFLTLVDRWLAWTAARGLHPGHLTGGLVGFTEALCRDAGITASFYAAMAAREAGATAAVPSV